MKKCLVTVGLLACASGVALAGPNAGGVLMAHDANLLVSQTDGSVSICGQGIVPATCGDIDTEIDGSVWADPSVFKVYAAFPEYSSPRLMGLTWGITYTGGIVLISSGMCGDFEMNDPTWPASGTGSAVTYNVAQTSLLTAVYWFMGYNYYAPAGQSFQLGPNPSPTLGGYFGDDSIPVDLDPITCFGTLGFDQPGQACLFPHPGGVCCDPATGECTNTLPADCAPPLVFHPEFMTCDPNPCLLPMGACCPPCDGCLITTQAECTALGGTYVGDMGCDPSPCTWPPIGACCVNHVCTIEYVWACEQMGGTYYGDCSVCDPTPCPPPTPIEQSSWGRIKARFR